MVQRRRWLSSPPRLAPGAVSSEKVGGRASKERNWNASNSRDGTSKVGSNDARTAGFRLRFRTDDKAAER